MYSLSTASHDIAPTLGFARLNHSGSRPRDKTCLLSSMSYSRSAKHYLLSRAKYKHLNAFNSYDSTALLAIQDKKWDPNSLHDKPVAIKDNICTKDLKTTASSGILKNFTSPYNATVVDLLQDAGTVIVGKTNMDEFGMGSHSTNSHFGPVKMQRYAREESSAGGSSGGSAMAVASGACWAALGTDTGGSVRLPAAYTGVTGFKPTYGRLSRWGVIPYANSMDTVGILGRTAAGVEAIYGKLNVYDPQDPTSLPPPLRARIRDSGSRLGRKRIGIPLDYNIATLHPKIRTAWIRTLRMLWEGGHTLHPVRLPATQHALSAYYVLAPAEASSNLAKYDGVRFGSKAEGIDGTPESVLFSKTRGQGFGSEVQRRILLGAFSLSAEAIDNYFIQAQKVRRLVQQDFDKVFTAHHPLFKRGAPQAVVGDQSDQADAPKEMKGQSPDKVIPSSTVDVLICPTAPSFPPALSDVQNQDPIQSYMNDVFTVPASLAGLPAITVPIPVESESESEDIDSSGPGSIIQSAGVQIIGQFGDDSLVLDYAKSIQERIFTSQKNGDPHSTAWSYPDTKNEEDSIQLRQKL